MGDSESTQTASEIGHREVRCARLCVVSDATGVCAIEYYRGE